MHPSPAISVIMPVYNAGKYVEEAIQSILDQSFSDFEFIIINDGSTDNSLSAIKSFKDNRIRIIVNKTNIGNYPSRNKGMSMASGKYICVMDADDVSFRERLETQFGFMETHHEVGLAGSGFRHYRIETDIYREENYERIKVLLFRNICFIHPTIIMRHEFMQKFNLRYDERFLYAADYDLIVRAARFFPVTNITKILHYYRIHGNQISSAHSQKQSEYVREINIDQLRYIGINPDKAETELHINFIKGRQTEYCNKESLYAWIHKILNSNRKGRFYDNDELESSLNALLLLQKFCKKPEFNHLRPISQIIADKKDLSDLTFIIPVRIESQSRIDNIETVVQYLFLHFVTKIIIIECGSSRNYFPAVDHPDLNYEFIDTNIASPQSCWSISDIVYYADTPLVAIWNPDVIVSQMQLVTAAEEIKKSNISVCIPFNGKVYSIEKNLLELFRLTLKIENIINSPLQGLMNCRYSIRGPFLINKAKYMTVDTNHEEQFCWGFDENECLLRKDFSDFRVHYLEGPLYHMAHPPGIKNEPADPEIEKRSIREFLQTYN